MNKDAETGKLLKELGIAQARDSHESMVLTARRYAYEKGQFGPVTIDDVTLAMERDGIDTRKQRANWKGSVFRTGEWVMIAEVTSVIPENRAHAIHQWALKSWLAKNNVNGQNLKASAFSLEKIRKEFFKLNNLNYTDTTNLYRFTWVMGEDALANEFKNSIKRGNNKYMGIDVTMVKGVGAVLIPKIFEHARP
ncbi:hypothetical protein ACFLQL_00615 [Verrucomicrobiota bacterium]